MTIIHDLKPEQMTPEEQQLYAIDWLTENTPGVVLRYLDSTNEKAYQLIVSLETAVENLEKQTVAMEAVLEYIRDLARTGLPPAGYSGELWAQHKLVRIAAKADTVLNQLKATK